MIPILTPDGREAELTPSPDRFPTAAASSPWPVAPIDTEAFLDEPHHRFYGRPWVMGRYYFDQLRAKGLRRSHRVLDLGCGAGRVGVWLAAYLDADRYCGVDAHLRALAAFAAYESVLHGLEAKRPRLLHAENFEVDAFGERFDVALDFYVTPHLTRDAAIDAMARTAAVCSRGARLFSLASPLTVEDMAVAGFRLKETFRAEYPLLAGKRAYGHDQWSIYARMG